MTVRYLSPFVIPEKCFVKEAIAPYGYTIDYDYYCKFCNGRHYLDFLPQITTDDKSVLYDIHKRKKDAYSKYLDCARINTGLVNLLIKSKGEYRIALVTTASQKNTEDILKRYNLMGIFDLILTHEDIIKSKPDPEGFLKAMKYFNILPQDSIIFEDSDVGIEAAEKTGATVFVTKGFN